MSNSVDNRVVSMEFDNAKFERNVAQSLDTLKHLDKSLDGLTNSSKKFDGVSFEDLANSIDSIASRFTLMGRITQKVFDEIASGIVNLGKKMVNDFAIEPVTAGWDKYAEKTTSVQTIMNATGESIEFVEEQLGRLNRFTDETSYNFSDMTSNIAKFTSQGIELDTAVTQMQGIATWAASAGQNAQAASRAMYNISQAMGAGSMKLIDWKSIQNANMATKEFKEQAIAAGIAAGTLVEQEDKIVTATGGVEVSAKNFEQTLQKGWFNTQAMQKVFSDYGKFADTVDEVYESFGEKFTVSELMEWSEQMENAGDSAEDAADFQKHLAEETGLTGKELDELTTSLQKLNSEELKFSRATYKAAQEAKTFGDAVDATKDAVSTAWMNVFQTIFGNYEEARHLWTDMANWWYDIFAEPVNALQETLDHVMGGSRVVKKASDVVSRSIESILGSSGVKADEAGGIMTTVLKKSGLLTDEMIKEAGSVEAAISTITGGTGDLKKTIDAMLDTNGTKTATEALEDYRKVARDILRGDFGNGVERRDALTAAGFDPTTAQVFADLMHEGIGTTEADLWRLGETFGNLTDEQRAALIKVREEIEAGNLSIEDFTKDLKESENVYADWTGRELLFANDKKTGRFGALYDIMAIIDSISESLSKAWTDIFDTNKEEMLRNALEGLKRFTQGVRDALGDGEKLRATFKGLFAVLDIGKMAFSAAFNGLKSIVGLFLPTKIGILDVTASFGDWLSRIRDSIKENQVFEKAVGKVVGVFGSFRKALDPFLVRVNDLWTTFKKNDGVKQTSSFFSNVFSVAIKGATKAVEKLADGFDKLTSTVVDFYNKYLAQYVGKIVEFFNKLANGTISLIEIFNNVKSAIVDFFTILFNFIKNRDYEQFVTDLTNRFSGMVAIIQGLGGKLLAGLQWLFSIDKNTALTIVKLSVALYGFIKVLNLLKRLTSIKASFVGFLNSLSSSIKAFVRNYKVNTVLKIAASIGILAAALVVLSKIPIEDLTRAKDALIAIGIMFGVITAIVTAGSILGKPGAAQGIGLALIGFAASIAAAVAAIWVLTNMVDYSKIGSALDTLFSVIAVMAATVIAVSRLAGKATIKAASMLAFAAAILLTIFALQKIQNSSDTIKPDAFARLFGILLALAIASVSLKGVKLSSALGILLFVASLTLIQKMLKKFLDEALPAEQLIEHLDKFIIIVGMLLALAAVSRVAGGGGLKMAVTMVAIIGSIYVLAKVAAQIGILPLAQLAKGTAVVVALGLMIGAIVWLMNTAILTGGINKGFGTSIIAIVAAIVALGLELIILSVIPWKNLIPAVLAMVSVISSLAFVFAAISKLLSNEINKAKIGSLAASFVGILFALGGAFTALLFLSKMANPDTLIQAAESLSMVVLALAGALALISFVKFNATSFKDIGKMFLEMVAVLIPAVIALYALKGVDTNGLITKVSGLSMLLIALSGAAALLSLSGSSNWTKALTAMALVGTLVVAMLALVGILALLQKVPIDSGMLERVESISLLLLAISGVVLILSLMPPMADVGTMFTGILGFLGLLTGLSILGGLIGLLSEIPKFAEVFTTGMGVLGEALGKFVGAFVGGVISGASEALFNISSLADDIEKLVAKLKGFDASAIAGAKAMAGLLIALGAAELATALENILGGWFTKLIGADLGSQLVKFADAVVQYTNKVKELDEGDVNKVTRITNAMSNLLKALPSEGGLLDLFTGSKSQGMANLKTNLGGENGFGAAIKSFVDSVKDIDPNAISSVNRVKTIVESLGSMMESIGKSGGLVQDVMGESNIAQFGIQILSFIRSLVGGDIPGQGASEGILELAEKIPEDTSALDRIKTVTESLSSAIEGIPTLGGFVEKLLGSDDPATFGTEIQTYVEQLVEIGKKAQNITPEMVSGIERLAQASAAMNLYNSAKTGESAEPSVETSEKAVEVAENTEKAVNTIAQTDTSTATENAQDVSNMFGFLGNIFGENGAVDTSKIDLSGVAQKMMTSLSDSFTANKDIVLGSGKEAFGSFIEGFTGEEATAMIETSTSGFFTNLLGSFTAKTEDVKAAGTDLLSSFTSGFSGEEASATITASADGIIAGIISAIQTKTEDVKTVATELIASFTEGFSGEGALATVKAGAETIITTIVDALSAGFDRARTSGQYFGEGFAQGIESQLDRVKTAAASLAEAASAALDLAAQIKSPSRVARRSGGFFGEGFGLGIRDTFGYVKHQAEDLSNTAIDAVSLASDLASSIIESESNPTITPVLDLSEVRNGVRSISNLGSFNASVSANTVGAVSLARDAKLASPIQNGTPAPVTAVLSESAARALAGSHSAQQVPVIEFTGDLAQLARILQPKIKMQDNYHGKSLVR